MRIGERISVRERIAPEITASLFANYRSSADAVMELVDNAVDSQIAGGRLQVEITVHPSSLTVFTQGGTGMGIRELERSYLRWGGSPKRGRHMLGQYGQGGKAAIGHLGRRFTVEASRPTDDRAWKIADDDYRDRSHLKTYDVLETARRVPGDVGYVRIRVDDVDKRIDVRRLTQRLAETYRPLLESEALELSIGGGRVAPEAISALDRRRVSVNAAGGRIRGWIGVLDPDRPMRGWVPGLRCYKLGRLIAEGEFFRQPGPGEVPGMVRLMGEIDLPQVPLTMNKSDFDRDGAAWVEVEERLHRVLEPLARRLAHEADVPPPESALRVAEQVRRLLAQALRLSDRMDVFSGLAPASPPVTKREQAELPLEVPASADAPTGAEPRAPRPPGKGGRSRRGFGSIVIRALDPAVRSTTALEGESRVIVINSRYPLFRERRGDMWYQLETAAREICKLVESADVGEYEQRVNEVVLASVSLRERRRRPRRQGRQLELLNPS
jgi:hypothetical protein